MGVFGPISNRVSRRHGETSALDEFSFHVPEHCDARTTRLEIDCFKKKREFVKTKNTNMVSKHDNSLESLKSECDSEFDHISQEVELCLSYNDYEVDHMSPVTHEGYFPGDCMDSPVDESQSGARFEENVPEKCQKMLTIAKCTSTKVLLYPEEEWAKNTRNLQWTIKLNKWWKRYCTVTESTLGGSRTISAVGKIFQNRDGTLTITGRFKRTENPDFKLHLTAQVSQSDFQNGYLMTGALQLGDMKSKGSMEITHFAVIPKHQQ